MPSRAIASRASAARRTVGVQTPHAEAGQRIGLLGGSFNPPHAAHRLISETALKRLGLDRLWWIVTPGNPNKSQSELLPLATRVALCQALADDRRIEVTDFEKDLDTAYTAATLSFLRNRHREVQFVWIMGADNLASFHRWRQWRMIFRTMPIAVVDRPGWRLKSAASPAARAFQSSRIAEIEARTVPGRKPPAWVFLGGPLSPLSSTAIRRQRGLMWPPGIKS